MLTDRLHQTTDIGSILQCALDECLSICQCSLGNVQLMDWNVGHLEIKVQRGFSDEFLNFFRVVKLGEGSACARALGNRASIIIADITSDPKFLPCFEIVRRAGIRAVQSTPLVSNSGALVGVLSTHFETVHCPTEAQMAAVQGIARCAANAIIRERASANIDRVKTSTTLVRQSRAAIRRADMLLEAASVSGNMGRRLQTDSSQSPRQLLNTRSPNLD
jgi:GAF domain-containing protein